MDRQQREAQIDWVRGRRGVPSRKWQQRRLDEFVGINQEQECLGMHVRGCVSWWLCVCVRVRVRACMRLCGLCVWACFAILCCMFWRSVLCLPLHAHACVYMCGCAGERVMFKGRCTAHCGQFYLGAGNSSVCRVRSASGSCHWQHTHGSIQTGGTALVACSIP